MASETENRLRDKLFEALDPNNSYSYDDFTEEFGSLKMENSNFMKIQIKFTNKSKNEDPNYATDGASGFDLRANLDSPLTLPVGGRALVPTGLFFELPPNFEIQVRPRSGLALKKGVTVLNSPGTVDADYRGEIGVILINHGQEPFVIENGERIAQAVISTVISKSVINLNRVDEISTDTTRGDGGFGSTGIK